MKKLVEGAVCLFLALFLLGALPSEGEEEIYSGVIRLHVLAEDDSRASQDLKLAVRDAVLAEHSAALTAQNAEEAARELTARLPAIQETVARVLDEAGGETTARVELVEEQFDRRAYGDVVLPAGRYTSLQITLGAGEGQNWWCVLYPAMCTEAALGEKVSYEELALSPAGQRLVTGSGYVVRFRTLEVLATLLPSRGQK